MEFDLVNLLLVLVIAWVAGVAATRLGYPSILGELAAGIIFGPPLLGWVEHSEALHVLAEVGVFLMMLYIGMEVDYRDIAKASWPGLLAALGGFFTPFIAGYFVTTRFLGFQHEAALFMGLAMGVTSLATKSRILIDLKLFGTRIANVLIAAALICDSAALVVFAVIMGIAQGEGFQLSSLLIVTAKNIVFFGTAISAGLFLFPRIWNLMRRFGVTERTANFTMVITVGLLFASLAELAGLHSILGAFIAGMFLRSEVLRRKLSHEITTLVHDLSLGFLAPVFFFTAGFEVELSVFKTHLPTLLIVVAVAAASKILGACLAYLPSRNGWREGLAIGAGMNGHGAVEIVIASAALGAGLIDHDVFSILIFMAFITTSSVPIFMKFAVERLRKRGELVRADAQRKGVLIVGGMPLGRILARELSGEEDVLVIDSNAGRCASAEREGVRALEGNALQEEMLDVAGAAEARVFVAMTTNQEVNQVAGDMAANLFGVPEVHVLREFGDRAQDTPGPITLFGGACQQGLWNGWITQRQTRLERIEVSEDEPAAAFFAALGSRKVALPLVVEREGRKLLADTVDELKRGDRLAVLEHAPPQGHGGDHFQALVQRATVLDLEEALDAERFFRLVAGILADKIGSTTDHVYELLVQRERDSSTVIVPGVAIPHIMIEGEGITELVVARSREGVAFWGADSEARIIFVIAGSRDQRKLHLRILSAIAQLFQDPSFEERWMEVISGEELRQVVLSTERRRF